MEQLRNEMKQMRREAILYRSVVSDTLTLMGRAGIRSADDIRTMIMLVQSLEAAYRSLQLARMASGDPLAWLGAGLQAGVTVSNIIGCFG